jgi:hypothetical protein
VRAASFFCFTLRAWTFAGSKRHASAPAIAVRVKILDPIFIATSIIKAPYRINPFGRR